MRIVWCVLIGLCSCAPEHSRMDAQLGLAYLQKGDRPRAKQSLLRALENEPRSAVVNSSMAYFMEITGDIQQASFFYKKAMRVAQIDDRGAHWNNYGAFLCRTGDPKQAAVYLLKAAHYFPYTYPALAYENAGVCALGEGDKVAARAYFKQALLQDPLRKQAADALMHLED